MLMKALAAAGVMAVMFHAPAAKAAELNIQLTQYYGDNEDDRQYRPLPPPPPSYRHRVSCWRGARYVERAGYYRVRMVDCVAPVYEYRAVRRDRSWSVRVSARTGRILTVRPVSRRY